MKLRSVSIVLLAELAVMSLWFVSSAILPDMLREVQLSPFRQAVLSSGVQAGFVIGALIVAFFGLADRYDPRRVFAVSAVMASLTNAVMLIVEPGGALAITARIITGALLAGVYPVGMKIMVSWGKKDRGLLIGALVGALTLGSASPQLIAFLGGADWRITVATASLAALAGGVLCLLSELGPFHQVAPRFNPKTITIAWTNRKVRLAYAGYLGHMWELYAMWAWIAVACTVSYGASMSAAEAEQFAKLTAFIAIGAGAITCVIAGFVADKIGKAKVASIAMMLSGGSAIAVALTFGGPVWLTFCIVVFWGITIIPDSAQFSALVADATSADQAGSLMTLQTALGFALTIITVQVTPVLAITLGWPIVLAGLAIGPLFGIIAMSRLRALQDL